ncbi:methyltransferase domain-containing protein [Bradyrhizobium liaoningense]|nr:methyltransferase domain-containing protein [Bradyrhizobium liaoningense]
MSSLALTFDRSDDISKLEGCNTRGIAYRWDIFATYLAIVLAGAEVLDFGAGSLRESFDLVQRGFSVTSVDVSAETLNEYKRKYDWPADGRHRLIANLDLFAVLNGLGSQYALITAFDVLEHLADPVAALQELAKHLQDDGLMLVTVPNGWSLFELAFRTDLMIARATGRELPPMRPIVDAVVDKGSFFEVASNFGKPIIVGLARLERRAVMVLASDPFHYGGSASRICNGTLPGNGDD